MILESEEKKSELENQLSLPEVYSNGEKEYIECINKAAAVLKAAQMAEMEL